MTANGNIAEIDTSTVLIGMISGEGYGICNESPAQNYTDYGVSNTGNWKASTLLSRTTSSVKIARTTSDGHWTLTQTITQVPQTSSITVVMALTKNQAVSKVAYLVRYADPLPNIAFYADYVATINTTTAFPGDFYYSGGYDYGLELRNVGTPPFGFWQAYVQTIPSGPNACAFAYNASPYGFYREDGQDKPGSLVYAYVGSVGAGQTKTVTLSYRGL